MKPGFFRRVKRQLGLVRRPVSVLEFTDTAINFVQVHEEKNGPRVRYHETLLVPAGAIVHGRIRVQHIVAEILEDLKDYYKLKKVDIVLPAQVYMITRLILDRPEEDFDHEITRQLQSYIKDRVPEYNDLICEYDVTAVGERSIDVSVSCLRHADLLQYQAAFARAGIEIDTVVSSIDTFVRTPTLPFSMNAQFLVGLGPKQTHVTVMSEQGPVRSLRVPFGMARLAHRPYRPDVLGQELAPLIRVLNYLNQEWNDQPYKRSYERRPLDKIVLYGEGAHIDGIVHHLSQQLQLPVELPLYWQKTQAAMDYVPELSPADGVRLAPALSLGLKYFE